ncbi:MAG: ParB/RepB/Spo0J family partition protein [Thaumarchaeota archaeon]|nr:ParB/RepB/Spo0J family partition protein [Nitrososphaerota archaeon]
MDFDSLTVEPIELRMISPSKFPVRYAGGEDTAAMADLKESIKRHGLLHPILVRPLEHGFEIVAGHRRFAACRSLHQRFISCRICEFGDREAFEIQISENLQRKTMDPLEEAEAYQRYVTEFGWGGVTDLSRRIGKSEEYVSHRMQLLRLPDSAKSHVTAKNMNVSQALELVGAPESAEEMAEDVVRNKLTVKQIRKLKAEMDEGTVARRRKDSKSRETQITKKGILTLKIALSRMDDLVDAAHGTDPYERAAMIEFLMDMRRRIHSMIDEAIRFEKNRPKRRV